MARWDRGCEKRWWGVEEKDLKAIGAGMVENERNHKEKAKTKGNGSDKGRQDANKFNSFDSILALKYPTILSGWLSNRKIDEEWALAPTIWENIQGTTE
jgi:hypothetical protein